MLPSHSVRILDLGCGNGHFVAELVALGHKVVGVDPAEDSVRLAREQTDARIEQDEAAPGLLERLGEEPFNYVVSLEVVEHVYDPHRWAMTCYESLVPGGHLICSTPYHGYVKNLALALTNKFDEHWHPLRTGGHIKFWSEATLTTLLESASFKVGGMHGTGRIPFLRKSLVTRAYALPMSERTRLELQTRRGRAIPVRT